MNAPDVSHRAAIILLAGLLGSAPQARAAEAFPPVSDLPSRPDLPDPLVFLNGKRVETTEEWVAKRRPELKALFQHYMYGYLPPPPAKINSAIERVDPAFFGGKATKKEVVIRFGPEDAPRIHLLVIVPNHRDAPAPAFLGLNFCGNHTVVDDPSVAIPAGWMYGSCPGCKDGRATEAGRGGQKDVWAAERTIDRGYALATFYNGDIDPDRPDFDDGIHPFYRTPGERPGPLEWGTIAAWAWGIHRAVDYLVSDPDIDGKRIAAVGHSRNGKTVLLAAALDERIAMAIPHQAGCGGTAPSRGKIGESVKQINKAFPHWFNDTFPAFDDNVDRLPFDQHALVALVAPRPVLFTNAIEDRWANPSGQFDVLKAADPVYRFLGIRGIEAASMPEPRKLVGDRLGFFIRPGKHSMTEEDWAVFLDFADRHLRPKG
ncbi:MAG: acetylxylan esterase [Planctomycetes bacterium]|nr:acetylxylan esterase [Planctomycetota bacterium]